MGADIRTDAMDTVRIQYVSLADIGGCAIRRHPWHRLEELNSENYLELLRNHVSLDLRRKQVLSSMIFQHDGNT